MAPFSILENHRAFRKLKMRFMQRITQRTAGGTPPGRGCANSAPLTLQKSHDIPGHRVGCKITARLSHYDVTQAHTFPDTLHSMHVAGYTEVIALSRFVSGCKETRQTPAPQDQDAMHGGGAATQGQKIVFEGHKVLQSCAAHLHPSHSGTKRRQPSW